MKIIADQNIPLLDELFSGIGSITRLPGREISAADVKSADVLLVRSITKVDEKLLKNSRVKFVGSCTIGFDHLDIEYLNNQKILWSNAPACNANAVVQYVLSVMATLKINWRQQKIGIIGCGNIGSRLYKCLKKLDVDVVVYDPFLDDKQCQHLVSFEEVLQADIVSCHTPLTYKGEFPTYHLINEVQLNLLKQDALLINAGRGGVIDNKALLNVLTKRALMVALDVWENEPKVNRELVKKVALSTPHIAGYSLEGKEQGSYMIYQALCRNLGLKFDQTKQQCLTMGSETLKADIFLEEDKQQPDILDVDSIRFNQILLACYNVNNDDALLKENNDFDALRKNYRVRREYAYYQLPTLNMNQNIRLLFSIVQGLS